MSFNFINNLYYYILSHLVNYYEFCFKLGIDIRYFGMLFACILQKGDKNGI